MLRLDHLRWNSRRYRRACINIQPTGKQFANEEIRMSIDVPCTILLVLRCSFSRTWTANRIFLEFYGLTAFIFIYHSLQRTHNLTRHGKRTVMPENARARQQDAASAVFAYHDVNHVSCGICSHMKDESSGEIRLLARTLTLTENRIQQLPSRELLSCLAYNRFPK